MALLIHAILLFGDFSRLQFFSAATPELKSIDISLVAYSPPILEEIPSPPAEVRPVYEAPDSSEKMEDQLLFPQQEVSPQKEFSEPPTATQPLESPSDEAETAVDEPEEAAPVWRKPKRSLKALTKVIPKDIAKIRRPPQSKTKKSKRSDKNDTLSSSSSSTSKEKLKSEVFESETSWPTESQNKPSPPRKKTSLTSALKDAANPVASLNKNAPAAKMILAKPLYRHNPPPKYPNRARRRGLQGIVILEVLVDETGQVEELTVFTSSGHTILDRAARASVKKWLFQPGTRDGHNVKTWVRVPIRFQLN
jgi:protein TonB